MGFRSKPDGLYIYSDRCAVYMYIERPGSARRRAAKQNVLGQEGQSDGGWCRFTSRSQKAPIHPLELSSPPPCRVSAQRRSARFLCIGKTEVCDGDAFVTGSCYNKAIARGYVGVCPREDWMRSNRRETFFFLTETVWRKTTERLASANCPNNNASSPWSTSCD